MIYSSTIWKGGKATRPLDRTVQESTNKKAHSVTLLLVGDIMLGGEFLRSNDRRRLDWAYPFKLAKPLFQEADIVFGNLECPLSNAGQARKDKSMALYAPSDSVAALKYLGFNVISLSNNHINDYGEEGMTNTIEILRNADISCFGAGRNLLEASQGVTIKKNGLIVSFLGYTTPEEHVKSIIAGPDSAGCIPYDLPRIENDIARLKNNSDIICISLHWGYELYSYPSFKQVKLAHRIIDAGADIVVGHHPHIIQGVEKYRQGVIFYSLGNFFFPDFRYKSGVLHAWKKESNEFIMARCKVGKTGVEKVEVYPGFRDKHYRVIILDSGDREHQLDELDTLSRPISSVNYKSFWGDYRQKREKELVHITFLDFLKFLAEARNMRIKDFVGQAIAYIKRRWS